MLCIANKKKGRTAPVHAVKVYTGSRGMAPLILNPGTIDLEAGWAPEPVRTVLEKKKSLSPTRIRTPHHLARS
jgi:hypothetical protein